MRAMLLAVDRQGADARVPPRRGGRGRAGGDGGRPRGRRRGLRAARDGRHGRGAVRPRPLRGGREPRCARRSPGCASAGSIHYLYSHVNLADALFGAGRLAEAREVVEEGDELAAEKGAPRRWLMMLRSELAFEAGDWAAAEAGASVARAARAWARPSSTTRCAGSSSRSAAATTTTARRLLDEARDVAADTREPQWIGPLGSLRAELERRAGDLDAARGAIDDALDRLDFCSQDVARMARVAATGVRVEADAAVRARDLGEDPSFAIGQRRRADRARRGVRRGRAAGRGRVPGQRPRRGGARPGRRRPGPVDRGRRRVGGARAPVPRRAGAAAQGRGAARARRPRRGGRERARGPDRRAGDRRARGSRRRSRASRCARGCGWSPTSLRRHPR